MPLSLPFSCGHLSFSLLHFLASCIHPTKYLPPFLSTSEQFSTLWEEIAEPGKLLFVSQPQLGHCGYPGIFSFLFSCPSPILFNDLKLLLSLTYVVSSFLADSPLTFLKKLLILYWSIAWRIHGQRSLVGYSPKSLKGLK